MVTKMKNSLKKRWGFGKVYVSFVSKDQDGPCGVKRRY